MNPRMSLFVGASLLFAATLVMPESFRVVFPNSSGSRSHVERDKASVRPAASRPASPPQREGTQSDPDVKSHAEHRNKDNEQTRRIQPTMLPAQASKGLTSLFGDLIRQPIYATALRTEVVGELRISRLLADSLADAGEMGRFVAAWDKEYAEKQSGIRGYREPDANAATSFKAKQLTLIGNLHKNLAALDRAVSVTARADKWPEWILLTRSMLFVTASIPEFTAVKGMEQEEGKELLKLRLLAHEATVRRQEEWRRYLASKASLPDAARKQFDDARNALRSCDQYLRGMEMHLASNWKTYQKYSRLWIDWRDYFDQGAADSGTIRLGPEKWALGGSRTGLVAYPYVLAERLELGSINWEIEGMGFEGDGDVLSIEAPVLRPRMRIVGTFLAEKASPITVTDLRLVGEPIALDTPPEEKRKPADWLTKLTADGQDNAKARQFSIERWQHVVIPTNGAFPRVLGAAWRVAWRKRLDEILKKDKADELPSVVGDFEAVRARILMAVQADMKARLEKEMADLSDDPRFNQCRKDAARLRDSLRALGGNEQAAVRPERIAFDACQQRFDEWSNYAASMLPAPRLGRFDKHPWPNRFSPEILARSELVDATTLPAWRELDRLQIKRIANGNGPLQRALEAIAGRLEPAQTRFRTADFRQIDAMKLRYAEVDRLLLVQPDRVETYLSQQNAKLDNRSTLRHGFEFLVEGVHAAQKSNWELAASYYWKAAKRGVPHAQYLLATLLRTGQGIVKDEAEASKFYIEAAQSGHCLARVWIGWQIGLIGAPSGPGLRGLANWIEWPWPGLYREEAVKPLDRASFDESIYQSLGKIINHGADLYNQGDLNGCYRLWEGTLMSLKPLVGDRLLRSWVVPIKSEDTLDKEDLTKLQLRLQSRLGGRPRLNALIDEGLNTAQQTPPSYRRALILRVVLDQLRGEAKPARRQ